MAWFNSENWIPWDFKRPWQPFALPAEIEHALDAPAFKPAVVSVGIYAILDDAGLDEGRPINLPAPSPPMVIPGLVGELVEHCWHGSPRQIPEVAIASALSTMSLFCSRSYRHGSLGLSLYMLVLAQSSIGKSFGFKANDTLLTHLQRRYEGIKPPHSEEAKRRLEASKNIIITDPGSAQGLKQHIAIAPSTLWQADEFVDTIKEMARPNPPAHIAQLKSELLKLVEQSGPGRVYRGAKYSTRSNKMTDDDVKSASLTVLATGVPEKFYDDMSSDLLTSGFLPRFTIMEYNGSLMSKNENVIDVPDPRLVDKLVRFYDQAYNKSQMMTGELSDMVNVEFVDQSALTRMKWWENVCERRLKDATDRGLPTGALWSRAMAHVSQIASLIAIGVNYLTPRIEENHINIAISIVRPTLDKIANRVENNQIGMNDDRRVGEIKKFMARMFVGGFEKFGRYTGVKADLINAGVIQVAVVRNYCKNVAAFRTHPAGSMKAFNEAFNDMVKYGDVKIVEAVSDGGKNNHSICCTLNIDVFKDLIDKLKKGDQI